MPVPETLRLSIAFLLLSCSIALAQEHLTGEVRYSSSKEKASGVNVIVRSQGKLLGYDITGDGGEFCIDYDSTGLDSVAVSVTGFDVKQVEITVPCNSGRLTLVVQQEKQTIREVRVTAPAIKRQSDTLTYYVENFRAENDRSIGDVLKKLPGIQVAQSGEIKYNGKSINKFYIEGLDMFGGKYGVATNNVQAKDVAAIEVYEDHQPIKLLQDWVKSDRAAINLRLKEKAKGTWNVLLKGGLGYKPLQWDVEALPMYFGGRFQTISTYKTNNVGKDVSRELESFFGNEAMMENILNVSMPQLPPFDESRYLSNNIHVVNTNVLTKLSEDADFTAGVNYVHDLQNSAGRTSTMYYIPGESPLVIDEIIDACDKKDILGIDLQFRNNSRTSYLLDYISFEGQWQSSGSGIIENGSKVSQKLSGPKLRLMNQLQYAKIVGKWNLTFESMTSWKRLFSDFVVSPTPFSSFLGKENPEMSAVQGLDAWVFSTDNRFNAYRKVGNWTFSLTGAMGLWLEDMQSSLSGGIPDEQPVQPADSLKNRLNPGSLM